MLSEGLYERIQDDELRAILDAHPELSATFERLEDEAQPETFSQFVNQLLLKALSICPTDKRAHLVNSIVDLLGKEDGLGYTRNKRLLSGPQQVLRQIRRSGGSTILAQPGTSLRISSLLTGSADDPQLERELRAELMTSDRVEVLVSFIKWSGLQLLLPAFENLAERKVPVRIITTSYMGASDPQAVEWLAGQASFEVKVSYDTERTRLHAKAYHFTRRTGYSTAYIGSANMSRPAMTSGLEWTVKVTAQDMPHILERFSAEFETYWASDDFSVFDPANPEPFRAAIFHARRPSDTHGATRFYADLKPHPFQERILEALADERTAGLTRNLVISATGTGKTVIAAFDYAAHRRSNPSAARLLFVVHRKEILHQARDCFRAVLRDFNFGELMVDGAVPAQWDAVFASVQSLNARSPWQLLGANHFDFIIIDEAHHGTASSYRPLFEQLQPQILLGLTATPERMDGSSILPDFNNRFAAEIRLPEALEEKLLCPFHYFGVTDPVSLSDERFWRSGKYDTSVLESVYTGDDIRAINRLNAIFQAIDRYQPITGSIRCVGFCVSVRHAEYMAARFREKGLSAEVVLGTTAADVRDLRVQQFRSGKLQFLFAVDVVSEGIDIPEINLVLFLRPTESLTVFLQQLGRGLRHSPGKDCLTVLDFVGQAHRKYRMDRKFSALLRRNRRRIDEEVELDFPNLPPGCNIQLERVAREHVLNNIRQSLGNLRAFVPEVIQTMAAANGREPTFGEFIEESGLSPLALMKSKTWSEWKQMSAGVQTVTDPNLTDARRTLRRVCMRTDPWFLAQLEKLVTTNVAEVPASHGLTNEEASVLHYLLWSKPGSQLGFANIDQSFSTWLQNHSSADDLAEVIRWRLNQRSFSSIPIDLGFSCPLRLHGAYGYREITAAFGLANLKMAGPTGVGVIHIKSRKTYLHFITFRKEERDFAPTTRYKDYPISRTRLHWESQAGTTQASATGQNYLHFKDRSYQVLFFARLDKRDQGETCPFIFLGPAKDLLGHESDRPIKMIWDLEHPIPAALFEFARAV